MSKSKSVSIDTKKARILSICFIAVFIVVVYIIPIVHVAAEGTDSIDWGVSYEVGRVVEGNNRIKNAIRYVEYNTLKFLCVTIDEFDKGLTTLLDINLYTLIKNKFNITSVVYPVAWALVSLSLVIAAVMLLINADKMRLSDFFRNLLVSIMLLVALPTLVSQFSALRTRGVKSVKSSFNEDIVINEDTTITSPTLGQNLLANSITRVKDSVKNNKLLKYSSSDNAVFKSSPERVYSLPINQTIHSDSFDRKWSDTGRDQRAPAVVQKKYETLTLEDKITLLDAEFTHATSQYDYQSTILSIYEYWEKSNKDDHYIEVHNDKDGNTDFIYTKVGGAVVAAGVYRDRGQKVWCRFAPYNGFTVYSPVSQIFEGDTIYTDVDMTKKTPKAIPYLSTWKRIDENNYEQFGYSSQEDASKDPKWYSHWQYDSFPAFNYITKINCRMVEYMNELALSNDIPSEFNKVFTAEWSYYNLIGNSPSSVEELIRRIEDNKVYLKQYGTNFSLIEYLNMEENYRKIIEDKKDNGVAQFEPLHTKEMQEAAKKDEPFSAALNAMIYVDGYEEVYYYYLDFLPTFILVVVTLISMCFAMVKIVRLLFDLLFAQIVAPLVVASDLSGSGRAKQVVQNLISCNIVMIAVIFILRLYIYVLISAQDKNYPFTVLIALTVGGAMFVIDGPDLIVKILGVDAGVKSGAAAIMSIRSATQIAGSTVSNTSRAVGNVVKKGNTAAAAVAGGLSGQIHGAINGAKSGFENGISKHTDGNGNFNSVGGKIATYGGAFGSMLRDGVTGGFTGFGKGYLAGESEARNSQGAVSTAVHGMKGVKEGWNVEKNSNSSSNIISSSTSNNETTNTSSDSSIVTPPKTDSGNSNITESAKGEKGDTGINGVNGHNGNDGKNGIDGINGQNNVNTTSNNTANIGNAFNKPTNNIANEPTNQRKGD
ncbi:hypothetical protein [Ruminococcus albus]|uniref:hypothetical protein n=1 Tax=Ruminococcus albus TaxID=1264 RepID=UPI00046620C2|nr:hypothetical protein [Ruminococcus albus]